MNSDDIAWTLCFPNQEYCDHPQCSELATHIVVQVGIGYDPEDFAKLIDTPVTIQSLPKARPEVAVMPVCGRHEAEIKRGMH